MVYISSRITARSNDSCVFHEDCENLFWSCDGNEMNQSETDEEIRQIPSR